MRIELEIPEHILHDLLDGVDLPRFATLSYTIRTPPALRDLGSAVLEQMAEPGIREMFEPGQRIAIGVGSRGIGRLPEIVRGVVSAIRRRGADPFIIPSMGSHGGATAEGQRRVLAHLGVTEDSVDAPIVSDMDTVVIGHIADGTAVHLDRRAAGADGIVFVARVKPHTAFRGPYESGLAKMIAIGLGKQAGASTTHARGFGEMAVMVPEMARIALEKAPIRLAIAVIENAHDEPYKVLGVPSVQILDLEPELLVEARAAMPRLPFDECDVLIIDRIGKNISGDGADPNITGRYPTPYAHGGPQITKHVVLDLDAASAGNANGVGTADFTTVRLVRKLVLAQTYPNALTSTVARPVALPMVLPSDHLAIAAALLTCNAVGRPATVVRIRDTLHLDRLIVSEALLNEVQGRADIEVLHGPAPLAFDELGNLLDLDESSEKQVIGLEMHDVW